LYVIQIIKKKNVKKNNYVIYIYDKIYKN